MSCSFAVYYLLWLIIASSIVWNCSQKLKTERKKPTTPRKNKRRRGVESPYLQAALDRLTTPLEPSDEYSCTGEMWAHRLRSQMGRNPEQGLIAQKLINEIFFLASFDKLTFDSKIVYKIKNWIIQLWIECSWKFSFL